MDIKIKISKEMSGKQSLLGSIEDRLIRMSKLTRDTLNLKTGLFLDLSTKDNKYIPLQIAACHSTDLDDKIRAFVSENTYNLLQINKNKLKHNIKLVEDILIGSDPEFFLIDGDTGGNISASHFFTHYGGVGSDCGLAELRPRPGKNEYELTENLYTLLKQAYYHLTNRKLFKSRKISMVAASHRNGAAAGFHIHFGLPKVLLNGSQNSLQCLEKIVSIFDYYIGIPSILPEGDEDNRRRSAKYSRYGKPGDHRWDNLTLEYRVPGGHLLRHPVLSTGILGIGSLIINDILNKFYIYSDKFKNLERIKNFSETYYPNLPSKNEISYSISNESIKRAVNHVDVIIDDLSNMNGFKEKASSITDYFQYVLKYLSNKEKFSELMEFNWRLNNEE
jgi:hypothetical protein